MCEWASQRQIHKTELQIAIPWLKPRGTNPKYYTEYLGFFLGYKRYTTTALCSAVYELKRKLYTYTYIRMDPFRSSHINAVQPFVCLAYVFINSIGDEYAVYSSSSTFQLSHLLLLFSIY